MGTNDGRQSREGGMERWSGRGTEAWIEEWEGGTHGGPGRKLSFWASLESAGRLVTL